MKKVLIVADVDWWVFAKIYKALKKYLTNWNINVHYARESLTIPHTEYDIILFLCDHLINLIDFNKIPPEKLILAIRSESIQPEKNICEKAKVIVVANKSLLEKFQPFHSKVMLAPGGVDTRKFKYVKRNPKTHPVVGWAGSKLNFGEHFRGLNIIQEACDRVGFKFRPALREDRLRTEDEMVEYYCNEIDIYVDMSLSAGRQNGVLEAGCCGLPIILSDTGLAKSDLIIHKENALICNRTVEDLKIALEYANQKCDFLGSNIRKDIEKNWDWKVQASLFEKAFLEVDAPPTTGFLAGRS